MSVRYAKSGGVHVAYDVFDNDSAGLDIVVIPGFVSHVEWAFEEPSLGRFFRRLNSFARLTIFDKRGTGLSDRSGGIPTMEERMDDIRAVMDAAGIERAALFGVSEGGPLTLLFAATYPDRVQSIALYGTYARFTASADYAYGLPADGVGEFARRIEEGWGTGVGLSAWAPSMRDDARFREWWARAQRLSASPADARALVESNVALDVRPFLPAVSAPTLVLHRSDDRIISVENGRYLGEHLPHARFVELPGADHFFWTGDHDGVLAEIEEFFVGTRGAVEADRVLTTILFTDIVNSTQRASELGDAHWRQLLDQHDSIVLAEVDRYRGRTIKQTGDGVFASFDGPARAIRCANAIVSRVQPLGLAVRAGLHTGECERRGDDLGGVAVHLAARIAECAAAGEVLVSRTVTDLLVGNDLAFTDRGEHDLRGIVGTWQLFAVDR